MKHKDPSHAHLTRRLVEASGTAVALRPVPTSEDAVNRAMGLIHKQLGAYMASNGKWDVREVAAFRALVQSLVDLRREERESLKAAALESMTDEELRELAAGLVAEGKARDGGQ